jgi:hypothetical protein
VGGFLSVFCEGFPQRSSLIEPSCVACGMLRHPLPGSVVPPHPRCFTASYFGNHLIAQILLNADSLNSFRASAAPTANNSLLQNHSRLTRPWDGCGDPTQFARPRRHGATATLPLTLTAPLLNPVNDGLSPGSGWVDSRIENLLSCQPLRHPHIQLPDQVLFTVSSLATQHLCNSTLPRA